MNYRFLLSIHARRIALTGEAMVSEASRDKAEAVLRATLANPEAWATTLVITRNPDADCECTDQTPDVDGHWCRACGGRLAAPDAD